MRATTFLLLNLALAFYNVGTIWAHEIDIFRTWRPVAVVRSGGFSAPAGQATNGRGRRRLS